jgi:hypothetical protein
VFFCPKGRFPFVAFPPQSVDLRLLRSSYHLASPWNILIIAQDLLVVKGFIELFLLLGSEAI